MPEPLARFVDLHHHAGADLYRRRRSVLATGRVYAELGGWVVVKSHLGSTAAAAWEARQEGLPVSGSVTLNDIGGGLSVRTMERAVFEHGDDGPARLVVYLPTLVGSHHTSRLTRVPFHPLLDVPSLRGTSVSSSLPAVREILRAARDLPVVVATGHATRDEILTVVDCAVSLGLDRLLLTHPTHPMCGLTLADLASLADVPQVYVELTALTRLLGHHDGPRFAEVLHAHPRVVHSSDLGQPEQPDVSEWLGLASSWFAEAGLTPARVAAITAGTPGKLLALPGKHEQETPLCHSSTSTR
ncbi:hypothetical protein Lesp02_14510 [Lentzea sp. NBRC 105346]|uniref:DUF6282 family protein n=1 Tax=Lentzea sp. NBRC 105346 TaxID=3032205 RepID=UPI0024A00F22|nr:DUF6282 family protein [Lentzea sp. NBRC 105346]GLZ29261.1 hypothetical protein Lesp02_14510 [Lentzea sp. NBRC 105346]